MPKLIAVSHDEHTELHMDVGRKNWALASHFSRSLKVIETDQVPRSSY